MTDELPQPPETHPGGAAGVTLNYFTWFLPTSETSGERTAQRRSKHLVHANYAAGECGA